MLITIVTVFVRPTDNIVHQTFLCKSAVWRGQAPGGNGRNHQSGCLRLSPNQLSKPLEVCRWRINLSKSTTSDGGNRRRCRSHRISSTVLISRTTLGRNAHEHHPPLEQVLLGRRTGRKKVWKVLRKGTVTMQSGMVRRLHMVCVRLGHWL